MRLVVEEVTSRGAAFESHHVAPSGALEPGRVVLADALEFAFGKEVEEFLGVFACRFDDSDYVPRRWKTHDVRAAMVAMMAAKLN